MKNILGQDLEAAEAHRRREPVRGMSTSTSTARRECRPKRKMGHITFVGMTAPEYERGVGVADLSNKRKERNMNYRIFVEKQPRFRVEAESLRRELNANLNLHLGSLRLLNVYDLFGFTPELLEKSRYARLRRGGDRHA